MFRRLSTAGRRAGFELRGEGIARLYADRVLGEGMVEIRTLGVESENHRQYVVSYYIF